MAKERAPRRRGRWFLLALLVGAAAWYIRSRSAVRRVQLAAPPPVPVAPRPVPAAVSELAVAEPSAVEETALDGGEPAATELEEGHPAAVSAVEPEAEATAPAETAPAETAPAETALDIAAESLTVVEPETEDRHIAEAAATPEPVPAAPEPAAPEPVAQAEAAASPPRRPRPRPRPRQGGAGASTQVETPPEGTALTDGPAGEQTPAGGFGPTSATATPAPDHALFTPASADGVGAGAVPGPDGAAPGPEYTIKGNADSMLFHTPESPYYERTRAEVWFRTADEAAAAGFTEWRPHRRTG
jgi:hypothetical protein